MASHASIGGGGANGDGPASRRTLVWMFLAVKAPEAGYHGRTAMCGARPWYPALHFSFQWPANLRSPRLHGRLAAFADHTAPAVPTSQRVASPTEGRALNGPPARADPQPPA